MSASSPELRVALVRGLFLGERALDLLTEYLLECHERGAEIAVLPELALHSWSPATREVREEDAEEAGGPRELIQCEAAATAGIALLGTTIRRNPGGVRENTSLFIDKKGELRATYAKMHLPEEPGFFETSHYSAGTVAPQAVADLTPNFPFGARICSDINRPLGSHVLRKRGATWVANPRATEAATYDRWRTVFLSTALTTGLYVASVPRPADQSGVRLGGPSVAISPTGEVLCESEEPIEIVTLKSAVIEQSLEDYPGYLPQSTSVYAEALR